MNTHLDTKNSAATAVTNQLLHLLHRAGQAGDDLFAKTFRGSGLTHRQYAVLTAAQRCSQPSQAALVAETGIDRSTLADIIVRLIDKGLVERHRTKQDARAYVIQVTDKGQETIADLAPRIATVEKDVLTALPESTRPSFVEDLSTLVSRLSKL